jgi:glycosyltransferase involved in cell wall biosynthesis
VKIGIVIGRIGGVDGVALETEKWIHVLEKKLKYQVFIITGELERPMKNVTLLPELAFHHKNTIQEQEDAFYSQKVDGKKLRDRLIAEADYIEKKMMHWIFDNKIDCLLSENASALPCHLTMGMAIKSIAKNTKIKVVTHDHDFWWERGDRYKTKSPEIRKIIRETFPLQVKKTKHGVINLAAKDKLKKSYAINSIVVPNVMDFSKSYAQIDLYNKNMKKDLGFKDDDILLFQITRIVRRKGIEAAVELVAKLNNPKVHLVITGRPTDDYKSIYTNELKALAKKLKVSRQIHFLGNRFDNFRGRTKNGKKIYDLIDGYAHATACTYFSTYEGFGNAYVECVLAKKPIFVNNYKPVYWPDIGSKGFKTVQIENLKLTNKAVKEIESIIYDPKKAKSIADHNYKLGKKHFSYEVLARLLKRLFI